MMLPVILLQLIILVTSSPQSKTPEIIENLDNVEVGLPMAQALVDGENSDLGEHPWHVGIVREESKTGVLGWIRHLEACSGQQHSVERQ